MVNISNILSNFKKINELDVGELKILPIDLKRLSDVVNKEVTKNTIFDALKTKVNTLDKKFFDVTTLIHINQ